MSNETRLLAKSIPVPEAGCWLWLGSRNHNGYGYTGIKGLPALAHRAAYSLLRGQIPAGMLVCHHCDTRSCINPDHLFLGTHRDNARDAAAKGRVSGQSLTHCKRGHEFTPVNTILLRGSQRECRTCKKAATRAHMRALRARRKSQLRIPHD